MLFNSLEYVIFLPLVFLLYWFVFDYAIKRCKHQLCLQNLFVVIVSYIFYGWWNWRFLVLIFFTSLCSWGSGILIFKTSRPKLWLTINILINLIILGFFKYYNFFVNSFCDLFNITNTIAIQVILPVGISFYTFQALSYSIDVYRKKIKYTNDCIAFFAYVSFFPQLVAGPIERATNLLPQFEQKRIFSYNESAIGMRRILWGMFKKIVVADTCALYVDMVWNNVANFSASTILLATVLFAFQIYGDFSGYSDIAIGTAKLFGINLKENFLTPYFSRNVAEFWKRWHISLNTWFVDYLYIPLGGNRHGKWKTIRNTFAIFLVSGLWHGANWTYLTWGLYHALLFVPLIFIGRTKSYKGSASWKQIPQIILTFMLVSVGWIIFRAPDINTAFEFVSSICNRSILGLPTFGNKEFYIPATASLLIMSIFEWVHRDNPDKILAFKIPLVLRWLIYLLLAASIIYLWAYRQESQFIYFIF